MHFKMIIALTEEGNTEKVLQAAREAGATGATVISNVRGEGLDVKKSFFGLSLESVYEMLIFVVEEHLSRTVLETIEHVGHLEEDSSGIAFQLDIDDVVGIGSQINKLQKIVEEKI
jgi:nitrogen regulatory protein PII